LARGDRREVDRLLESNGNRVIASLAHGLLDGNFQEIEQSASSCMRGSFSAKRYEVTAFCNQLLARAYLARGELKSWSETVRWFLDSALPEMRKDPASRFSIDTSPDSRIDYERISEAGDTSESTVESSFDVPIDQKRLRESSVPFVTIKVNGQETQALVDTGSPYSLILSRRLATRLGAVTVAHGLSLITRRTPSASDDIALVSSINAGAFTVENLGAIVIDESPMEGADAIIGLAFVQRFPTVGFGREAINIRPALPRQCMQPEQFSFATSNGRSNIIFPVSIDGVLGGAVFDTGSESFLALPGSFQLGKPKSDAWGAGPGVTTRTVFSGSGTFSTQITTSSRDVEVLGQKAGRQVVVQTAESVWDRPWLGTPVFANRTLFVSFKDAKACFTR